MDETLDLARSRKRYKIGVACEKCRAKKIRCDGIRPQCGACARGTDVLCVYTEQTSRRSLRGPSALQVVQDRLAGLEAKVSSQSVLDPPGPHASNALTFPFDSETVPEVNDNVLLTQQPSNTSAAVRPDRDSSSTDLLGVTTSSSSKTDSSTHDVGTIDAMGLKQFGSHPAAESGAYYSEPSAASFLADIQGRRSSNTLEPGNPSQIHRGLTSQDTQPTIPTLKDVTGDDQHLPARSVSDRLLYLYWLNVQSIYPFLHWPTFIAAYERLWMPDSGGTEPSLPTSEEYYGLGASANDTSLFHCGLNAAFALAAQFSDEPAYQREEKCKPFIRRSRHLLNIEILDTGDIAVVQALLIYARYLQATRYATRSWHVAGMACRAAQALGLHIDTPDEDNAISSLAREIRRRVWHCCTCLDTVSAMLTGRPSSYLHGWKVSLPTMADHGSFSQSTTNSTSHHSATCRAYFIQTISLNKTLHEILCHMYSSHARKKTVAAFACGDEEVALTIRLDRQLSQVEEDLPSGLEGTTNQSRGDISPSRQRFILRTRLLHTRELLLRPHLVSICEGVWTERKDQSQSASSASSVTRHHLSKTFRDECSTRCIHYAQEMIDHIGSRSAFVAGSPWFNCYFMCHAIMILILADIAQSHRPYSNQDSLTRSWTIYRDFYDRMSAHGWTMPQHFRLPQNILNQNQGFDQVGGVHDIITGEAQQESIMDLIFNTAFDHSVFLPTLEDLPDI